MEIQFTVDGAPVAKQRPRLRSAGGRNFTYTPQRTVDYENWVRLCYRQQTDYMFPPKKPLSVKIECFYKIPKSSKAKEKRMLDGAEKPVVKPDLDNVCKSILDAGNGLIYPDDNQTVKIEIEKRYSNKPRVEITIKSEEDE